MNSSRRAFAIALLVAGAFFMENLDGTVIATALPRMAQSLGSTAVGLSAGMVAYMLTIAVLIPISGWIADRMGARSVFAAAILVFTVSSIFCGLCQTPWQFTLARVVQGAGGALMTPVGRLVVLRNTEKRELMRSIATITWPALVAPIIAPPLGGYITTYFTWRWIFFLNVPLGLVGIVLTGLWVPNLKEDRRIPLDGRGFVLSGLSCLLVVYALDRLAQPEVDWHQSLAIMVCGVLLGAVTVWHSLRTPHPLIDFRALKIPTYAVTIWGGSLFRIAIGTSPFLLPILFQEVFGLNPMQSGSLVLAVFAGNLAMKPGTTAILRRFGFRNVLLVNGSLTAFTLWACALLSPSTPRVLIIVVLFAGGLCRSMQFTALNTIAFADVPQDQMTPANTFASMVSQVTMGVGISFGALCLRAGSHLFGSGSRRLTLTDFQFAFIAIGVVSIIGIYDAWSLPINAGAEVSGHVPQQ